MAGYSSRVNRLWTKLPAASLFFVLLLFSAAPPSAAEPFTVGPVKEPSQVRLLPADAWPLAGSGQGELLLKLSYIRGLIDALQYVEVAPESARAALSKLAGKDLNRLVQAIDQYYRADKVRRELPPAAVFFRILPLEFESPPKVKKGAEQKK